MLTPAEAPAPGVYELTDEEYFGPALARTTLSASGAKELLKPGGPARFRHRIDHPEVEDEPKREFDVGHAVHYLVLGAGRKPVLFPGTGANPEAWQKNDDKAAVAALRAEGKVPLRPSDWAAAHDMAAAVRAHPIAGKLFTSGEPERTLIWPDPATGVLCRSKVDWLRDGGIVDLKTAADADEVSLSKAAHNFGYAVQDPFYRRGFRAVRPGVDPWFVFVSVEKTPPYLVHVWQLSERAQAYGDRLVSQALEIYRDCTASGEWPGYPLGEITDIDLPAWVRTEEW